MDARAHGDAIAVDTALWIEGLIYGGAAEELIKLSVTGRVKLITSEGLIEELSRTLKEGLEYSDAAVHEVIRFVRDCSEVLPDEEPRPAAGVPHLLTTAVDGQATCIATTDRSRLLEQEAFEGIPIVGIA